ncbi:MAG: hypothetical protein JO307_32385 [Bryobacterales bacterium]|nr:hypothetical protein [Bryobacterales bacterium]MBV9400184.1 hypothetical protein [Bryobacterales bacterium]
MIRKLLLFLAIAAAVGVAALYLPLDFLRPSVERAMERGLGRKVEVGHVYINLFGVPGFTFEDVTIHEDPGAGIEPFAYVPSLNAGIRIPSLLRHRLVFSSLSLGDATVNVVKSDGGLWNFQLLRQENGDYQVYPPSIKIRGGRVNFKFGELKSVFYFNDADLDVTPYGKGSVEVRFGGAPSRTDRAAPDFGHFFVRANWSSSPQPHLDALVELERGSLDEIARLIDPSGFGLQGFVSLRTQLSGAPDNLDIAGELRVEDVHRWDLLSRQVSWRLPVKGTLDLERQAIQLGTTGEGQAAPFGMEFAGSDFLTHPNWEAGARFQEAPFTAFIDIARQMGAAIPEKVAADGMVSGQVKYTNTGGITGDVQVQNASVALPDAKPLRSPFAAISIHDGAMFLESAIIDVGEKESADIEGSYAVGADRGLDLRIATRGMSVGDMRSFGLASIPVLEQTAQGSWRGWARYRNGEWSGEYELQNARVSVDGLADLVRIQSASVRLNGKRAAVTHLRARAGKIAFTGDYHWEPDAVRPHRFNLTVPEADAAEIARLFAPALSREQGFFARTLRLAPSPAPRWLKARRADGTLTVDALTVNDTVVRVDKARVLWDATKLMLAGIEAHVVDADTDQATLAGDGEIGLERGSPHFKFDGKIMDVPYKSGKLDFEGTFEADGIGSQLLDTARAEGRLRGRSVSFAPDAEFRSATACFSLLGSPSGPVWKLGEIEALQGSETYSGAGVSQPDGRLVLDLTRGGKPVRFMSALFAAAQ